MSGWKPPETAPDLVEHCASILHVAETTRQTVAPLSTSMPDITPDVAYAIQAAGLARRGARRRGFKLGYTSAAMRAQMGIDEPNYGVLTDDHFAVGDEGLIAAATLIHPLAEPEIALLLARDCAGPGVTARDAWRAVSAALPAIELVDTRYHAYTFTLPDNIADNSSGARVVLGHPVGRDRAGDLRHAGVQLWAGGRVLARGLGADALGDPYAALAWLANKLAKTGQSLAPGDVVMTGGLTRAHPLTAGGSLLAEFGVLGHARLHLE